MESFGPLVLERFSFDQDCLKFCAATRFMLDTNFTMDCLLLTPYRDLLSEQWGYAGECSLGEDLDMS